MTDQFAAEQMGPAPTSQELLEDIDQVLKRTEQQTAAFASEHADNLGQAALFLWGGRGTRSLGEEPPESSEI